MKRIIFITIFFVLFVVSCFAQTSNSKVTLSGKIQKFDKSELKIKLTLENNSGEDVFIATNPQQIYGGFGYYLLLDETNNFLLKIASRVYPPSITHSPYSNDTRVELEAISKIVS